jgi:Phosphate-selective porin O and P
MRSFTKSFTMASSLLVACCGELAVAATNEERIEKLEAQVEALTEEVEQSAGRDNRWDRLHIGGYGELNYNNLDAEDPDNDLDQVDFHRFVLFFGYEFTEKLRFYSELELEHAFTEDSDDGANEGELELEQAYIQYDINDNSSIQGGLMLIPVGILNETHEPPTFYGVERNDVENIIISTTWWEAAASYTQRFDMGLSWDLMVSSGLNTPVSGSNAFRVRSGRQKVSEAIARDGAVTTRLKYTGYPGLEVAGTVQYQAGPAQGAQLTSGVEGIDDGLLFSGHLIYNYGPFGFRGLYARWDFSGAGIEAAGVDEQRGWYVEPSVKPFSERLLPILKDKVGFYFRYEDVKAARTQDRFDQWETGFNFWPHPSVVLKFDYRDRSHDLVAQKGRDFTGFDLGIGYQF